MYSEQDIHNLIQKIFYMISVLQVLEKIGRLQKEKHNYLYRNILQKMFQQELFKNQVYILRGSFLDGFLKLNLSNLETQTHFEAHLNSLNDGQILANYFDDLQALFQYLKEHPKLISINENKKKVTVYSKIQTKKATLIQIGNISFSEIFSSGKQLTLDRILAYFSSNQNFTNKQLGSSICFIAQSLKRVFQQKKIKGSDIQEGIAQRIYEMEGISKQYIIQESQKIYSDLFQQINLLKSKGQKDFQTIRQEMKAAIANVQQVIEEKNLDIKEKIQKQIFFIKDHVENLILDLSKQQNYEVWLKIKDYCSQQQSILKETLSQESKKIQSFIKKQLEIFENCWLEKNKQIKVFLNKERFSNQYKMIQSEKVDLKEDKLEEEQIIVKKDENIKRSASQWIDPQCYDFNRLIIREDVIKAKNGARVFGKSARNKKFEFTVKLLNMHQLMKFGIIDGRYKKFNIFSNVQSNRIVYWSDRSYFNGTEWKYKQGKGFMVGQSVIVKVDLELGVVQWKVGQEMRYQVQSEIIKKRDIEWVPYIFLWEKGDSVMVTYDY